MPKPGVKSCCGLCCVWCIFVNEIQSRLSRKCHFDTVIRLSFLSVTKIRTQSLPEFDSINFSVLANILERFEVEQPTTVECDWFHITCLLNARIALADILYGTLHLLSFFLLSLSVTNVEDHEDRRTSTCCHGDEKQD